MGQKTLQYTVKIMLGHVEMFDGSKDTTIRCQNCAWACLNVGWAKRHYNTLSKLCLDMCKCWMGENTMQYTVKIVLGHV